MATVEDVDALIAEFAPLAARIIAAARTIEKATPTTLLGGQACGARIAAAELRNHLGIVRRALAAQTEEAR